jgi:U3 small nucleolar RNA-associated protein 12
MVKAYLRYEFTGAFGVITSGAPSCWDASGKLLITSALENVAIWNVKQGTQVCVALCGLCGVGHRNQHA